MAKAKPRKPVNRKPLHIRAGDEVVVLQGENRDLSTPRKVLEVHPREGRVVVEGVNVAKDRQKVSNPADSSAINQPDFIEKPLPIDVSNVALIDPRTKKPTRVRWKIENGVKIRVSTKSGEVI